jgi:hypothetical protein
MLVLRPETNTRSTGLASCLQQPQRLLNVAALIIEGNKSVRHLGKLGPVRPALRNNPAICVLFSARLAACTSSRLDFASPAPADMTGKAIRTLFDRLGDLWFLSVFRGGSSAHLSAPCSK